MTNAATIDTLLPMPLPTDRVTRAVLTALRRLAIGGLTDAHAANCFMATFGISYARPLMFLRVLVGELSRVARRPILVAPCCCIRMTAAEAAIIEAVACARGDPRRARGALARTIATLDCLPAVHVAQALADALDDIGHPMPAPLHADPDPAIAP